MSDYLKLLAEGLNPLLSEAVFSMWSRCQGYWAPIERLNPLLSEAVFSIRKVVRATHLRKKS